MINKIKAIPGKIWADIVNTYERVKVYLIGLLALIALLEWRKIKAILLLKMAQKEMKSDQKQDQAISQLENKANIEANTLVKQAEQLPSQQPPVSEDWYKNQKGN